MVTNRFLGHRVFQGCNALQSVQLPTSLIGIGDSAFDGCTARVSIAPPSLLHLGHCVFQGCKSLETAEFPAATSLTGIGNLAVSLLCTYPVPHGALGARAPGP